MDHKYIDQHDIAGRYLRKELQAPDRDAFLAHMVDCPECADRVLLAEMFEADQVAAAKRPPAPPPVAPPAFLAPPEHKLPLRARIVAHLSPWQIAMLFMLTVLVPLGIVSLLFLWELERR
jgi:anti-sigma factor RsiW